MAQPALNSERKPRWGRRLIVGLFGIIVVAALAITLSPVQVAEFFVERLLRSQGLAPVSMDVRTVGFSGAIIDDLNLGEGPDLSIETLEVSYSLGELMQGRLRNVAVDGVRVVGTVGDLADTSSIGETFSLGVLDRIVTDIIFGQTSQSEQVLPQFEIGNGIFRLEAPSGYLEADFRASVDQAGKSEVSISLKEESLAPTQGAFELDVFDVNLVQGQDQLIEADLLIVLGSYEGAIAMLKDARLAASYREPDQPAVGDGSIEISVAEFSLNDDGSLDQRRELQSDASPFDAFTSEFVSTLKAALSRATASTEFMIHRQNNFFDIHAVQPLTVSSLSGQNGVETEDNSGIAGVNFQLVASSIEGSDRWVTLRLLDDTRVLDGDVSVVLEGRGVPSVKAEISGSYDFSNSAVDDDSDLLNSVRVSRMAIDMAPWTAGDLTIGTRDLSLTLQGTPDNFAGRVIGDVLLDGPVLENVAVSQGSLGLAGRFTRDLGGLRYTQASDACVLLATSEITLSEVIVKRPQFSVCANQQEPLIRIVFGEGQPLELQLNTRFPSEYSLIRTMGGFELEGPVPEVTLYTEYIPSTADWRITYGLSEGAVDLAGQVAKLEDLRFSGQASGRGGEIAEISAFLDGVRITDPNELDLYSPLDVKGELTGKSDELRFLGQAFVFDDVELAQLDGTHDLSTGSGELTIDLNSIKFGKDAFEAEALFPVLSGVVADVEGDASARGLIEWQTDSLKSSGTLTLSAIDLASSVGPVKGINGQILLNELLPPSTRTPQKLNIDSVDIGLELLSGELEFSLNPSGTVVLESASWPWAGGKLGLDQSLLAFESERQDLTLTADNIDLQEVFTLLDVEGLSGTGTVNGQIPIYAEDGNITIVEGRLVSSPEGGTILYDGVASDVGAKDDSSTLLFDALKDFTYDELEVVINGRTTDVLTVGIQLNGSNPTVLEGFPIKLNVNAEAPLVEMIRQGTIGYRIPDEIERRIQDDNR